MKTSKDYTIADYRGYGEITVPAGTLLTHQTASGIDTKYHFVADMAWITKNYPMLHPMQLLHDADSYGIDVPVEYVDYEKSPEPSKEAFVEAVTTHALTHLTKEEVEAVQEAARVLRDIWTGVNMLNNLWDGEHSELMHTLLDGQYPSTLPSFEDLEAQVLTWEEAVSAKADQLCQNLTVSTPALIDDTLAKDIIAGKFKYSHLTYTIEFDNHNKEWELTIISSSSSELEGSDCGVLESYYYKAEEDAKADIDAVAILTKCSFDRI